MTMPGRAEAALRCAARRERIGPGGRATSPAGPRASPRPARRRASAGWAQETTARPSTMTVQAPHEPSGAQPSFIERRPQPSRSSSRRLAPGARLERRCACPFSVEAASRPTFVPVAAGRLALSVGIALARHRRSRSRRSRPVLLVPTSGPFGPERTPVARREIGQETNDASGLDSSATSSTRASTSGPCRASATPASSCPRSPSSPIPTRSTRPSPRRLAGVDPDAADPRNLFRVHWYNGADRRTRVAAPGARRAADRR